MRKMGRSLDGVRLKKGDKAWYETNAGLTEVAVGEPLPWCNKWIAELKYCWASKKKGEDWISGKHLTKKDRELLRKVFGTPASDRKVRR